MVSLLEKKIEEMQLEEMQLQFKEIEKMLVKKQETVQEVANLIPVIQEVPVIDSVLLDKLTFENEQLKVSFHAADGHCQSSFHPFLECMKN
ncbi:myosin-13-like [Magnolia sinica]|uniref:myosin-13-like n=1 Tax=Magnolia sinica TaxID=86752 RepID=UPI00265921F9|nr:myosin-13-like [Magnolia sinica]